MQCLIGTAVINLTQSDLSLLGTWLQQCVAYQVTATATITVIVNNIPTPESTMTIWFLSPTGMPSGITIMVPDPDGKLPDGKHADAPNSVVYSGSPKGRPVNQRG